MRAVLLLFDSLNLRALSCYGGAVPTPNFDRLAQRTTVFERHFVGSMPCMPARRDLMTGRYNFLHRSWGPLEPFDVTLTGLMTENGVHSHLVTDHYHYFRAGGATYHTAFTTWDFIRGQEADPWDTRVDAPMSRILQDYHPDQVETKRGGFRFQGNLNRDRIRETPDFPCVKTFDAGLEFLDQNRGADGWFLQLETFDPHEPFHAPPEFRQMFPTNYAGPILDWPRYRRARQETPDEAAELRANYTALVALCDAQLGRLLDEFDRHALWDDTALIVTTDHGFLLGEHDWWGKNRMPFYNEIAHIPLFIHAPGAAGRPRSGALSQNIDVTATLLELFGIDRPDTVRGRSLMPALSGGGGRDMALYGIFGGAINATDGRHSYFRYPVDMEAQALFEYTLMPQHSTTPFTCDELRGAELHPGFGFTRGAPVLKVPATPDAKRPPMQGGGFEETETVLYDLTSDPGQRHPVQDAGIEARFLSAVAVEMARHEAPAELFTRFGMADAAA
jgi:arylsulfatase A-like enzyme